jgi:IS5 family transposase
MAMFQQTFAAQVGFDKYGRKSRRELFLDEMEQVVPWVEFGMHVGGLGG